MRILFFCLTMSLSASVIAHSEQPLPINSGMPLCREGQTGRCYCRPGQTKNCIFDPWGPCDRVDRRKCATASFAHVSMPEPKIIEATSCEEGMVNPQNALKPGGMTSEPGLLFLVNSTKGSYEVGEEDILVTIPVTGEDDSYCLNDGYPTTFQILVRK